MSRAAGVLLAAALTAGPAAAEIGLTAVRIAQGDLWVIGQSQEPNARITLDERFEQTTDGRGRFEFRVVYHPAACIVTLRTPSEQRQAVVQGCGQTGPRGDAGAVGPQGPAGPPGPPGPRGSVETAEAPPSPPSPLIPTAPAAPPQRPQAAPTPPAAPPARATETARLPDPVPPPAPAPARPTPPPAPPGPPVLGEWLVEDGAARIAIQPCGSNVCGSISWSKEGGELGTQILRAMKPTGPNKWEGTIYDPTTGRSYSSNISLRSSDSLRVEGCVLGVLCGGQTWTRAR